MRTGHLIVAAATCAALTLSGCAAQPEPSPYATAAAADLQQTVLHVTEAAGDGEYAAASTRLDELEVAAKVAHARGELTAARRDSILAAIALVRADLERLIAEAEAKAAAEQKKAEEEAREAAEAKAAEEARQAAEAEAEAEREAAEQAAQQEAAGDSGDTGDTDDSDDGNGKASDDKGSGNGKGKGKGKGKG